MTYQVYNIHLFDGTTIEYMEDYKLPCEKGIVGEFTKAKEDHVFTFPTFLTNEVYVPKRSILYIGTGGVKKVKDSYNGIED